jgi:nucleoside-diphosphate-sugar epimerase
MFLKRQVGVVHRGKYLVTGGTGFIGSALVRRLVTEGNEVRVLDNDLRGAKERLQDIAERIEMIQADIRNPKAVQDACRGMDRICHLAYVNGTEFFYTKPDLVLDIGVRGMVNVLDGCIKEGVKELFLASSSEVYQTAAIVPTDESVSLSIPDPLNPRYSYAGGKIISELMAINYGRKFFNRVVIFRPHNVYGPDMGWEHVIPQFAIRLQGLCTQNKSIRLPFPVQGSGEETRSFIFIDDFINGMTLLLDKGEHLGIYHIGTMEEVPIKRVAVLMGKYFGREIIIVPGAMAKGGTRRRCPDITKLSKLGFSPTIPLEKGLLTTTHWYAENSCSRIANQKGGRL